MTDKQDPPEIRRRDYRSLMIGFVFVLPAALGAFVYIETWNWIYASVAGIGLMTVGYIVMRVVAIGARITDSKILAYEASAHRPEPSLTREFRFHLAPEQIKQADPEFARPFFLLLGSMTAVVGVLGVIMSISVPDSTARAIGFSAAIGGFVLCYWMLHFFREMRLHWELRRESSLPDLEIGERLLVGIFMMDERSAKRAARKRQTHRAFTQQDIKNVMVLRPTRRSTDDGWDPISVEIEGRDGEKSRIILKMGVDRQKEFVAALLNFFPQTKFETDEESD